MKSKGVTIPGSSCRTDNYRALAVAGWRSSDPLALYVQFWDSSCYRLTPVTEAEADYIINRSEMPGCYVVTTTMRRRTYQYERIAGVPADCTMIRAWRG